MRAAMCLAPSAVGMPEGHPTTTEITVELRPEDGGTKMGDDTRRHPKRSPGATGWTMAFDKLATHLVDKSDD